MAFSTEQIKSEHKIIILVDVNGFSELSDTQQLEVMILIKDVTKDLISQNGYKDENLILGFVACGDGFYIVGDYVNSWIWGQLYYALAVSLRNSILEKFNRSLGYSIGVKVAIHFGSAFDFIDIVEQRNFIGSGMNDCSRLLNPENKTEIDPIIMSFYGHNNYVIISNEAFEKMPDIKILDTRISDEVILKIKHGKTMTARFVDSKLIHKYQVLSPKSDGY